MKNEEKKHSHVHVKDSYISDAGMMVQNNFLKGLMRKMFNRRVPQRRILCKKFSLSFSGTALHWHLNFLNDWYGEGGGKIACFFTEEGTEIIALFVKGDSNANEVVDLPTELEEYLDDREEEKSHGKTKFEIDWDSIEEDEDENEYRFQYEATLEEKGKKQEFFEYTLCEGVDKVVFRALIPENADKRTLADVQMVAKSVRIKH